MPDRERIELKEDDRLTESEVNALADRLAARMGANLVQPPAVTEPVPVRVVSAPAGPPLLSDPNPPYRTSDADRRAAADDRGVAYPVAPPPPPVPLGAPDFGLGPGRPTPPTSPSSPALPANVEVLDDAGYAQLVQQVGAQVAETMLKQGLVRRKRAAPVEPPAPPDLSPPYATPEMELAPPPVARPYQPPSTAALPVEHALPYAEATGKEPPEPESPYRSAARLFMRAGSGGAAQAASAYGEASKLPEAMAAGGGMEAMAGPVGAAIQLAEMAGKKLAETFDGVRQSVELVGHVTADAAKNDYLGAFTKTVDAAGDSLKKLPIVGEAAAAGLGLLVQPIQSFTEVVTAFVERGKEIARYSGPLATAGAMADVRDLLADIHEAQELGPGLAKLTDAQDRFWTELRADLIPIKKVIVDVLADVMQDLASLLRAIRPIFDTPDTPVKKIEKLQDIQTQTLEILKTIMTPGLSLMDLLKAINENTAPKPDDDVSKDMLLAFRDMESDNAWAVRAPALPDADAPLFNPPGPFGGLGQ